MISEKHLKEIFKPFPSPVIILLPDAPRFSIIDINDAYLKLNGMAWTKTIGKGLFEFFTPHGGDGISNWSASLQKVLDQKKPDKISPTQYTVPALENTVAETKYWEISHTPIFNEDNDIVFIVCAITDLTSYITNHEHKEQALAESRNELYSVLQTIEGILWEADANTLKFTFVSDHVKNILGFSSEEWINQPRFWENHVHPGDTEDILKYYNLKAKATKSHTFEYRMIRADGNTVWIKDMVSVIEKEKKGTWLRGLMLDITEIKRLSSVENLEKNVLELNSKIHVSVQEVLSYYLTGIEALFPQMQCAIHRVKNNRLYNWVSLSLPTAYTDAIDNLAIGENAGSCGTAAFLKQKVIVGDIASDPRWVSYRQIALSHNLRACWSSPVINSSGEVMATLGMYYKQPKTPNEEELKVIERVTAILKIILENRQQSEIISENNLLMRQGQELAHFGNWCWDVQHNVVSWSDTLYAIYGLERKDFKATFEGYQERLHPEDRQRVLQAIENVLKTKEDVEFEERIIRPNGEIRHLKSWGKLKSDANGQPMEMIGACLDITESNKTQEELQASESRLRALTDTQTNYVVRIDLKGKYTYYNKKYREDCDWILKDKKPADIQAFSTIQPYHQQLVIETKQKCIENPNRVFAVELDKMRKDGGIKPTLWHFIGLTDSKNNIVEIQCIGLDITDLKNTEKALEISNERYEYVNKASGEAIFDWDIINGNVKWGNGFSRLFGFEKKEEENSTFEQWVSRVHPLDLDKTQSSLQNAINDSTQGNWTGEYRLKKTNGNYANVEGNGYIVRDAGGKGIRMIGVIRDITEKRNHITAIEKQNEKLLEIAWMQSHTVRSPLSKIMGLIDLIKNFPNTDIEKSELLDHLLTSAHEFDQIVRTISEKSDQIDWKSTPISK